MAAPGWLPMGDPDWLSMGDPGWLRFPDPGGSSMRTVGVSSSICLRFGQGIRPQDWFSFDDDIRSCREIPLLIYSRIRSA